MLHSLGDCSPNLGTAPSRRSAGWTEILPPADYLVVNSSIVCFKCLLICWAPEREAPDSKDLSIYLSSLRKACHAWALDALPRGHPALCAALNGIAKRETFKLREKKFIQRCIALVLAAASWAAGLP